MASGERRKQVLLFVVVLVSILLVDGVWGQSNWSARDKERDKDRQREKKKHEESHAHKGHGEGKQEENRGEMKQQEREELRNQRIRELREPLRGNFQNRVSRAPPYPEQNRFDGNPTSASQKDKDRGRITRDRYAHAKHGREMKNNGSQRAEL